jgi:hypothetical protein
MAVIVVRNEESPQSFREKTGVINDAGPVGTLLYSSFLFLSLQYAKNFKDRKKIIDIERIAVYFSR